jgi:hypothetical protein
MRQPFLGALNWIEEDQHRSSILAWLEKECPFLNVAPKDAADQSLKFVIAKAWNLVWLRQIFNAFDNSFIVKASQH